MKKLLLSFIMFSAIACGLSNTFAQIIITQPLTSIYDSIVVKNVSCWFGHDGNIDLTVTGGTPPYIYHWLPNFQATEDIHNIFLGTDSIEYRVTITDAVGNIKSDSAWVHQPHWPLIATIVGTNIKCNGASTGAINLTPIGGTPGNGYQFLWTPGGAVTEDLSNIPAGAYQVIITDAHGCDTAYSVSITQPPPIIITLTPTNTHCTYDCFGKITSTVIGGTPSLGNGYTYQWNNGQITPNAFPLCVGDYSLTITDSLGCTDIDSAMIYSNYSINANATANHTSGISPLDVNFTYTGSGGTSYEWNFGDGTFSTDPNPVHTFITPASAQGQTFTYWVILIVQDSLCSDTFIIPILVLPSTGINDLIYFQKNIIVYPNPANEILNVTCKVQNKAEGLYKVDDAIGQILLSGSFAKEEFQINISSLAKGVYFLMVQNKGGFAMRKFIKQ